MILSLIKKPVNLRKKYVSDPNLNGNNYTLLCLAGASSLIAT